jgi:hypothetical protein
MLKALSVILLCVGLAHGTDQPAASSFRDFTGGLNTYSASVALQPNESPNLMNVQIDDIPGALTQRKGYLSCGNTPSGNTATSLYEYSKNDGSRNLIVSDNITIWQTPDCVQFSTVATGLGELNLPRFATIQDKLWIVNGSTYPIVWDGTTATALDGSISGRPLAPKGKLITYWKSRVWIGNTATSPSGLYFSTLVDSLGNSLDPATSTAAWSNTANLIYFNRDDGSPLYGIKVYRDNLYAFKETGILRLVFESEYTANGITVTKTATTIGSKFQESIVEMDDGLLRFVGRDGVYAFDGSMVKRISTKWTPTFYTIKQPSKSEQYKLWDSDVEWGAGYFGSTNISEIPGSISLDIDTTTTGKLEADFSYGTLSSTWTAPTGMGLCTITSQKMDCNAPGKGAYKASIRAYGVWSDTMSFTATNGMAFDFISLSPTMGQYGYRVYSPSNIIYLQKYVGGTGYNLCDSGVIVVPNPVAIKVTRDKNGVFNLYYNSTLACSVTDTTYSSSSYLMLGNISGLAGNVYFDNIRSPGYMQRGEFTSQISTATGLTVWKTFDTDQSLNGQTISYEIKTATSVYNIAGTAYRAITPGAVVSSGTQVYAQWKANFSTTDNGVTPILNSASIGWTTGDSTKSPVTAVGYKSRYWMSASTIIGNNFNDFTMVESKSPLGTHTRFDLPLSAMVIWNNNLYGAIGNTSKIARLDFGDTDDGATISSYWDSRDDIFDNPILYKSINRQIADYASVPSNSGLQIGLSPDMGSTWQYQTINTNNNPVLIRNTSVLNFDAVRALQFRSRVLNTTPGIGFTLYGLHSFGTLSDYFGSY